MHSNPVPSTYPGPTAPPREPARSANPRQLGQVPTRPVDMLWLMEQRLPIDRHVLRAGDAVYHAGARFRHLHIVNSGCFKIVNRSADGREQVVALHFKGDWLGLDGIAEGRHACDTIALDTGEVWSVRYDALLQACIECPPLLSALHAAMSHEIARDREWLLSMTTLPADARVAAFLRYWVDSLASRGLRTDSIMLRLSRAEIGSYLGMTLETVSRAMTRLARERVIRFAHKGRREVEIPDADALTAFVQKLLASPAGTVQ